MFCYLNDVLIDLVLDIVVDVKGRKICITALLSANMNSQMVSLTIYAIDGLVSVLQWIVSMDKFQRCSRDFYFETEVRRFGFDTEARRDIWTSIPRQDKTFRFRDRGKTFQKSNSRLPRGCLEDYITDEFRDVGYSNLRRIPCILRRWATWLAFVFIWACWKWLC